MMVVILQSCVSLSLGARSVDDLVRDSLLILR